MLQLCLGAGVLVDGLEAFNDGVLGEFAGQKKTYGGLDLTGGDGGLSGALGQAGGLSGDAVEDVVDERVHDGHGTRVDAHILVDLLQDVVDVCAVRLLALLGALFLAVDGGGGLLGGGLSSLGGGRGFCWRGHGCVVRVVVVCVRDGGVQLSTHVFINNLPVQNQYQGFWYLKS